MYGTHNELFGTSNSTGYGVYNNMGITGGGLKYGVLNMFPASANGSHVGMRNDFLGTSTSTKYGVNNELATTADGAFYGYFNAIRATANTLKYGSYTLFASGTGGTLFGSTVISSTTAAANQYGYYASFVSGSTGGVYGFYSVVPVASNYYAAFFNGKVYMDYRLGIGVPNPAYDLQLVNNSAAKPGSNTWTIFSDARLKKDVREYDGGLDLIRKMRPVWYTYTGEADMPQETYVGLVAQELQEIAPYMVTEWTYEDTTTQKQENYLAIDYGAMDFMLINAVKELSRRLEEKDRQLERQSVQLLELMNRLEELEHRE